MTVHSLLLPLVKVLLNDDAPKDSSSDTRYGW